MSQSGLKLKRVSKTISGMRIINDVTASFSPGKITALVGPNGAGKTTLFHLITGELFPDNGKILYNDTVLSNLQPYKVARHGIGRLFQDVRVFENLSVFDNVRSACYGHDVETPWFPFIHTSKLSSLHKNVTDQVEHWLDFVELKDMKDAYASTLSFGQQKLLAIARLLAGSFSVLLLDEPTAGLNPIMIKKVLSVLNKIIQMDGGKTIIIVEHNMSVVMEVADWVYFMHEGKIAFFGRTDHVLGDKEVREIYLGL